MASNGFKVTNISPTSGRDVFRGLVAQGAAGSGQVIVTDGTTEVDAIQIVVAGATVTELDAGIAQIGIPTNGLPPQTIVGGSSATLDFSLYGLFDITLTANCTLTFANPPPAGVFGLWYIILRQGGSGSYTVTWPAEVKWQASDGTNGGTAPTLYTAVGAEDVVDLTTLDGGTTYGALAEKGLIVQDEGTALAKFATTLNFVGSGVTATGTGPVKTITINGSTSPLTTKGDIWGFSSVDARIPVGDTGFVPTADPSATLGVSYKDPTLTVGGSDHAHVASETHLSDGATTTYTLDQVFMTGSVIAWNVSTLARLTVTETVPDHVTVSAAGSSGDSIIFDYAAIVV